MYNSGVNKRTARNGGVTVTHKLDTHDEAVSANVGSITFGPYSGTFKGNTTENTTTYGTPMVAKEQSPTLYQLARGSSQLVLECLSIAARIRASLFSEDEAMAGEQGEIHGLQNEMHATLSDLEKLRDDLYRIDTRIVQEKSK